MTWQEALTIKVRTKHADQDRVRVTNAEFRQALRDGNAVPGAGLIDLYASGDVSVSSLDNGTRRNVAIEQVALVLAVLNIINADWL